MLFHPGVGAKRAGTDRSLSVHFGHGLGNLVVTRRDPVDVLLISAQHSAVRARRDEHPEEFASILWRQSKVQCIPLVPGCCSSLG